MITTALEFRPIIVQDVTRERLLEFGQMYVDYIEHSKDSSLSTHQVLDLVQAVLMNPQFGVNIWLLLDSEKLAGFAITEIVHCPQGLEMNLSQAYIAKDYRTPDTQKMTIEEFEKYARSMGCAFITSSTKRDPVDAYMRWMSRVGFKKRCIVMEKDLREN